MRRWLKRIGFALALVLLVLTILNASWIAGKPQGGIRLIAHRGVYQLFDHKGIDRYSSCTATRIEQPVHDYLENTIRSVQAARQMGADMVEIDVAPTADGQMAVFHDWTAAMDIRRTAARPTRCEGHREVQSQACGRCCRRRVRRP